MCRWGLNKRLAESCLAAVGVDLQLRGGVSTAGGGEGGGGGAETDATASSCRLFTARRF